MRPVTRQVSRKVPSQQALVQPVSQPMQLPTSVAYFVVSEWRIFVRKQGSSREGQGRADGRWWRGQSHSDDLKKLCGTQAALKLFSRLLHHESPIAITPQRPGRRLLVAGICKLLCNEEAEENWRGLILRSTEHC